jgi:hypothetical protein
MYHRHIYDLYVNVPVAHSMSRANQDALAGEESIKIFRAMKFPAIQTRYLAAA